MNPNSTSDKVMISPEREHVYYDRLSDDLTNII